MMDPSPPPAPSAAARDAGWIAAIRNGDDGAYAALFRAYAGPLATYAYTIVRSRAVAHEVVQEALWKVWERRATLDIRVSVNTSAP